MIFADFLRHDKHKAYLLELSMERLWIIKVFFFLLTVSEFINTALYMQLYVLLVVFVLWLQLDTFLMEINVNV